MKNNYFDIVFLSYYEPTAETNFQLIKTRFPYTKRVDGVKGFINALKTAAEIAETEYFYLVDADNVILDSFDFSFNPYIDNQKTYIWRAKNEVNGLEYGYGGIKMYHKNELLNLILEVENEVSLESLKENEFHFHCVGDLPYTRDYKSLTEVASITTFDISEFDAWKAAFRECCKLAGYSDFLKLNDNQRKNAELRLEIWCTKGGETRFGSYVLDGANEGKLYGLENKNNPEKLLLISDFEWLKSKFESKFKS